MIPEAEAENFSDDEISVDVPLGSPSSSVTGEESRQRTKQTDRQRQASLDNERHLSDADLNSDYELSHSGDEDDGSDDNDDTNSSGNISDDVSSQYSNKEVCDSFSSDSHFEESSDEEMLKEISNDSESEPEINSTDKVHATPYPINLKLTRENATKGNNDGKCDSYVKTQKGHDINNSRSDKYKSGHKENINTLGSNPDVGSKPFINENTDDGSERVVSVSNVVIDSKAASLTVSPTKTNHQEESPHIEVSSSPGNLDDTDMSPPTDIEYNFARRRSSFIKIKLAGRTRHRLSESDASPRYLDKDKFAETENIPTPRGSQNRDSMSDVENSSVLNELQQSHDSNVGKREHKDTVLNEISQSHIEHANTHTTPIVHDNLEQSPEQIIINEENIPIGKAIQTNDGGEANIMYTEKSSFEKEDTGSLTESDEVFLSKDYIDHKIQQQNSTLKLDKHKSNEQGTVKSYSPTSISKHNLSSSTKNRPSSSPILAKRKQLPKQVLKTLPKSSDETSSITSNESYHSVKSLVINGEGKMTSKVEKVEQLIPQLNKTTSNTSDKNKIDEKGKPISKGSHKAVNINDMHDELVKIYTLSTSKDQTEDSSGISSRTSPIYQTTESCVTDINYLIMKTRKPTSPDRQASQVFIANIDNKDSDNNVDTKSLLLPDVNETGNREIKMVSQKYAKESDRQSQNTESEQLSLRSDRCKNTDITETKHLGTKPHKMLTKRQTFEDLHRAKVLDFSFLRTKLQENTIGRCMQRQENNISSQRGTLNNLTESMKHTDFHAAENNVPSSTNKSVKPQTTDRVKLTYKPGSAASLSGRKNRSSHNTHVIPDIYATEDSDSSTLQRTQSAVADTARLRNIRKLLRLSDDTVEQTTSSRNKEAELIIQSIIDGVLTTVCRYRERQSKTITKEHRCTKQDRDGEELLCCLLQTASSEVDPSNYTCEVINPLDVTPVTGKHELLVSNIVRISSKENIQYENETPELVVKIPIAHWYVEPWHELVIRHQDRNILWQDCDLTADVVKIDDNNKVMYGVNHYLTDCTSTIAVVARPRVTSVSLAKQDVTVKAAYDERVKIHVFASEVHKVISMQVVPVEKEILAEFQDKMASKNSGTVTASSPLLIIEIHDNKDAESMAFDVPYVSLSPRSERKPSVSLDVKPRQHTLELTSREPSPYRGRHLAPGNVYPPLISKRRKSIASPINKADPNFLAFHLVQIENDGDVRVKLLDNSDTQIQGRRAGDVTKDKLERDNDQTLRFSLYDKRARVVALETRGLREYPDVQRVTGSFINYVTKHKVKLQLAQDPRNVYSVLFSAMVDHPQKPENYALTKEFKHYTYTSQKEIQIEEAEVIAIVFRGNVDVPERGKLIYSFHGYQGIRQHFDIQVANPMSQRSLQTYHGALQIFALKTPRYTALDRSLAPCVKNGWELRAEFTLLLPKFIKATPLIINKAPVALKFQEPLTIDFLRMLCTELQNDWSQFAHALGVSHARIQAIKQQHRNQQPDKVLMDVLVNWLKTRTIIQDKVTPVINALRRCSKKKLAAELASRQTVLKQLTSSAARDKSLQRAFSLIGKSNAVTARWRQLLHQLFDAEGTNISDISREIDEQYTDESSKCKNALEYWKSASKAPSVWKLVDALRACRCEIAADSIVAMESKKK